MSWHIVCFAHFATHASDIVSGPPKLVVTPTKLTLLDPFHRGLTHAEVGRPPHYTKTRAPAISTQSSPRNGHLSVSAAPTWMDNATQPARKMGVASLLFHRTLCPKDALQVHSYAVERQQQHQLPHTQLLVHSYAREHQPRHLHHKACTLSYVQVQPSSPEPSCDETESPPEAKHAVTDVKLTAAEALIPAKQPVEEKPELPEPAESQAEIKMPEVEAPRVCSSSQSPTQDRQPSVTESPKNKRKVCLPPQLSFSIINMGKTQTLVIQCVKDLSAALCSVSVHFSSMVEDECCFVRQTLTCEMSQTGILRTFSLTLF